MTAASVESVQTCQWPSCQLVSDSSLATAIFIDHAYFKVELSRGSIASLTRVWRIFLLSLYCGRLRFFGDASILYYGKWKSRDCLFQEG